MQVRQMNADDWFKVFCTTEGWYDQVEIILRRHEAGEKLATWEYNCLRAFERTQQRRVAA